MKIMQVMAGGKFGGAEAFFVRLACGLHKSGLDQKVIIRENEARAQSLRVGGIEPIELKFGGLMDWQTPRELKLEIKKFSPDIVLTWMNRATAACPTGDFSHVGRLGGYYDLKYYQSCDHLIGNTQDIVRYLINESWPEERAHYLPNFVWSERMQAIAREEHYTPETAPLVLAMGRLHENKAFDVLLQALSRVPNAYLWIAGDGPLKEELKKIAEVLGVKPRVRFLGWRDDMPKLMAACDLFVCPSRYEPLGNVVVEAWAHNCPVIAADSLGPGTLIQHLESGVLVPVDDAETLAKAMRMVLEDKILANQISRRGFEVFESHFTEERVINRYIDFFNRIVV